MSVYNSISKESDGDIIKVSRSTILETVDFLVERAETSSEPILNLNSSTGNKQIDFDVDASVTNFKIKFNNLNTASKIQVKQPNGAQATPSAVTRLPGFTMYEFKYSMFSKWNLNLITFMIVIIV
jgi:hypothetical protein